MNSRKNASSQTLDLAFKSPPPRQQTTALRWLKFNLVGGIGIAVQLCALAALKTCLHLDYALATALAVETTLAHNFLWHARFTWPERGPLAWKASLLRFAKFNLTTGGFSILANVVLMRFFVDLAHIPYLLANLLTIACCSIVNFLLTDRVVFSRAGSLGRENVNKREEPLIESQA
jgi:putative flippase GtrA